METTLNLSVKLEQWFKKHKHLSEILSRRRTQEKIYMYSQPLVFCQVLT